MPRLFRPIPPQRLSSLISYISRGKRLTPLLSLLLCAGKKVSCFLLSNFLCHHSQQLHSDWRSRPKLMDTLCYMLSVSLAVFLLVTCIPYITVTMAACHVYLSSTQRILTRPLLILSFHLPFTAEATSYTVVPSNTVCFLLMYHPPECRRPGITGCSPFQIQLITC